MNIPPQYRVFVDTVFAILHDLDHDPNSSDAIIDFGCGEGQVVDLLVQKGYHHAMGFDVNSERIDQARKNAAHNDPQRFQIIEMHPYRLPAEDASVDLVLSGQVLEHVEDLDAAFGEFARIMRPDTVGIHIFPPKFRLMEAHTHVPLGNIIRLSWWHQLWICLGFRQYSTKGLSPTECAQVHIKYIQEGTFYRTEREIRDTAQRNGLNASFLNGLKYSRRLRIIRLLSSFPLAKIAYNTCISKVLVLKLAERRDMS